tara:strand:+ start:773 stop:1429 length:657 start_codon:yes stop_codon:yes gene_type:complete
VSSSSIKKSLSVSRLSTYENVSFNGTPLNTEQALKLYSWNAQISAAFLSPLHLCEVVIRNAISDAIESQYGDKWPWSQAFERSLPNPQKGYSPRRDLTDAKRGQLTTGKVIPELKFVFWEKLLTQRFDQRLWNPYLQTVFPNHDATKTIPNMRNTLRSLLEDVRRLRNRIAHHEPIFARDLEADFNNIDQLIRYRCEDTSHWAYKNQLVTLLMGLKPF